MDFENKKLVKIFATCENQHCGTKLVYWFSGRDNSNLIKVLAQVKQEINCKVVCKSIGILVIAEFHRACNNKTLHELVLNYNVRVQIADGRFNYVDLGGVPCTVFEPSEYEILTLDQEPQSHFVMSMKSGRKGLYVHSK